MWKWIACIFIGALLLAFGLPFGALAIVAGVFGLYVLTDDNSGVQVPILEAKAPLPHFECREVVMRQHGRSIGLRHTRIWYEE